MKKKTPLSAKITTGIATTGIILVALGMIKESFAIAIAGFTLTLVGFFASAVVSMILDIKKRYPSRGDPFQKKMRLFRYIRLIAGCTSFLSVAIVLYGLYYVDRGAKPILNLGLALIVGGIVVVTAVSVIMAVMSRLFDLQYASKPVAPPSDTAAIPYSADPVISRILANPYVLLDERIRQLHEVQNLLQYPEIQQIFFEPTKLYSLFGQDRVGELMNIVRDWITRNNAEEIFAAAERRRVSMAQTAAVQTGKTAQSSPPKKTPAIFVILFFVLWLMIFISIVSTVMTGVRGT